MQASSLEYRFRFAQHALVYGLGFFAPWERYTSFSLGGSTAWLAFAGCLARTGVLSFRGASEVLLVLGCALATAGAALRVWGTSYLGASVVQSPTMHGSRVLADGPYRHVRNPLYLGTFLNVLALSLLMPPSGAIFAVVAIAVLQLRLIGAEESFLARERGAAYLAYCAAVPRLWPSLRPRTPSAGDPSNPLLGIASEIFVIGCAISFIALGWRYNALLLLKGVLISLGVSLVVRAFIPRPRAAALPPAEAGRLDDPMQPRNTAR